MTKRYGLCVSPSVLPFFVLKLVMFYDDLGVGCVLQYGEECVCLYDA